MKRTTLTNSESRKLTLLLLCAAVVAGIIAGSCIFAVKRSLASNSFVTQYISPLNCGETLLDSFKYSALTYTAFILGFFLAGFFAFGKIIGIAATVYRGIGIGLTVGSLYAAFGTRAMLLTAVLIVPKILATTLVIVLAARETMKLSSKIYGFLFMKTTDEDMKKYIKLYCIKFLVLGLFMVAIAALESAANYFLMKLCI